MKKKTIKKSAKKAKKILKKKAVSASKKVKAKKPKFIAIEGGEGSGKSSLLIALKEALGDAIFTTREPGGSPYAELIRETAIKNPLAKTAPAETTLCLMFASRFDNVVNSVIPSLAQNISVVSDRFDGSSYAYQIGAQSNGALEDLFWILRNRLTAVPDLYIYIDVDPHEGVRRAHSRNQSLLQSLPSEKNYDHFDDREIDFHKQVRESYMKFLKKVPHIIIDANRPLEIVKKDFIKAVKKELNIK